MSHRTKIFKKLYKSAQDNTQNKSAPAKTDQPTQNQQDKKSLESSISDAYNKAVSGIGSAYGQLEGGVSSVLSYAFDKETAGKIAKWGTPALLGALFLAAYKYITTGDLKHAAIAGAIGAAVGISLKALLTFFGSRAAAKTDQTVGPGKATGTTQPTEPDKATGTAQLGASSGPIDYERERIDEYARETGYSPTFRDDERARIDEWHEQELEEAMRPFKNSDPLGSLPGDNSSFSPLPSSSQQQTQTSPTFRDDKQARIDEWLEQEREEAMRSGKNFDPLGLLPGDNSSSSPLPSSSQQQTQTPSSQQPASQQPSQQKSELRKLLTKLEDLVKTLPPSASNAMNTAKSKIQNIINTLQNQAQQQQPQQQQSQSPGP